MIDLIERLEAAEGPSRELDERVAGHYWFHRLSGRLSWTSLRSAECYTTSVDVAPTLWMGSVYLVSVVIFKSDYEAFALVTVSRAKIPPSARGRNGHEH